MKKSIDIDFWNLINNESSCVEGLKILNHHFDNSNLNPEASILVYGTLFHLFTQLGCVSCLEKLFDIYPNFNIHTKNQTGQNILHIAVKSKSPTFDEYLSLIQKLLTLGLNINEKDDNGHTPICLIGPRWINRSKYLEIIKYFIANGALYDVKDNEGQSLLCFYTEKKEVQFLLGLGLDINIQDVLGETLLMKASDAKMIRFLLENGVDPKRKDRIGQTALHHWVYEPGLYPSLQTIQDLLAYGADLEAQTMAGLTPLHLAMISKNKQAVKSLIQCGANINATENRGLTPLQLMESIPNQEVDWSNPNDWIKYKKEMHKLYG
jgi:ankyrin repeat protein